jgi:hypothetical protein
VAVSLARKDAHNIQTTVFYSPSRCDADIYKDEDVRLIEYSGKRFVKFLIKSLFARPDEVCMPHFRGNKIINAYARYAKKISAIDDGLDTFREKPRNINIQDFSHNSFYYTFDYDFPLASWLVNFNVEKVCSIRELSKSSKSVFDFSSYDAILVESPGLAHIQLDGMLNDRNIFFVKHSNPLKNSFNNVSFASESGDNFALEKSLNNFKQKIIVGESMVAVYCLLLTMPAFSLTVAVDKKNHNNLISLIRLIESKKHAKVTWYN